MADKDLLVALAKFRDEVIAERDNATDISPYSEEVDHDRALGKEIAFDEVVYKLNKIIQEHS